MNRDQDMHPADIIAMLHKRKLSLAAFSPGGFEFFYACKRALQAVAQGRKDHRGGSRKRCGVDLAQSLLRSIWQLCRSFKVNEDQTLNHITRIHSVRQFHSGVKVISQIHRNGVTMATITTPRLHLTPFEPTDWAFFRSLREDRASCAIWPPSRRKKRPDACLPHA
jgi:lambda repressor-like predicted transcriptional regulator